METFLGLMNERREIERYGMEIKLNLPRTNLYDFRIVYNNIFTLSNESDITICNEHVNLFAVSIEHQIKKAGYHTVMCDGIFTEDCFHTYLRSKDENKKMPSMDVYIHPNEMAGWASKKDFNQLLNIAKCNPFLSDVKVVYFQKVYNIDDEKYMKILRESEEQILDWLNEYNKHHKRSRYSAGPLFNDLFGIKRLAAKRLSYHDYVPEIYIRELEEKYF